MYSLVPSRLLAGIQNRFPAKSAWKFSPIEKESAPFPVARFDITTGDGRVYRVRVSDITPERETVA